MLRSGQADRRPTPPTRGCSSCSHADLSDDDDALAEALTLLRAHPALERARDETYAVARAAQALLDPLPDSDAKAALQALALSVVDRVG